MLIYFRPDLDKLFEAYNVKVLKDVSPGFLARGHLIVQYPDGSVHDIEYG